MDWVWAPIGSEVLTRHDQLRDIRLSIRYSEVYSQMTARTPGPDEGKENKVMDSSVQRWLTGLDSLSTIRGEV